MPKTRSSSLFYKQEGYFVGSISFDLLISENLTLESEVTNHPIETGANVSDHVRNLPRKGSLVGLVTNHPLDALTTLVVDPLPRAFLDKVGSLGGTFLQNVAALNPLTALLAPRPTMSESDYSILTQPQNRALNTLQLFKQLRDAKQPVIISTGLDKYQDVIVTKVSTSRDKDTGDALKFSVEFTEIEFRTLSTVEVTTTTQPIPASGQKPKVSKGKVGGKATKAVGEQPSALDSAAYDGGSKTASDKVHTINGVSIMKNTDGSLTTFDHTTHKPVPWHVIPR